MAKNIDLTTVNPNGESAAVACGKAILAALNDTNVVDIDNHNLDDAQWSEMRDYLARRGVTVRNGTASVDGADARS